MEILRNPKPPNGGASTMEEAADASASEWQTVQMETDTSDGNTNQSEQTSEDVARRVIERLAAASVTCTSPVAALAVALHAQIVLSSQFVCTGVPEAENSPRQNGFAAPIRDLPVTQFLPAHWDTNHNVVRLRYRPLADPKMGSMILTVQRDAGPASSANALTVSWEPVTSSSA
jgi:PI31 proteasome regulator N-terminal